MQLIPYSWVMTNSGKKKEQMTEDNERKMRMWNNRKLRNTKFTLVMCSFWRHLKRVALVKDSSINYAILLLFGCLRRKWSWIIIARSKVLYS